MIQILSLMCMLLWCCGSKSKVFFTFIQFSSGYTAHCCVFNNFSMVKQRHQFWDWISISVFKVEITNWPWILPQFTSIIRKLALVFFSMDFRFFEKRYFPAFFFRKKITFYIYKKSFWVHIILPKFQELRFCLSDLFLNHEFS